MTDLALNPTLKAFDDHWAALPKTGLVPHRRDFQPERLGRALAHMVVHELVSPHRHPAADRRLRDRPCL